MVESRPQNPWIHLVDLMKLPLLSLLLMIFCCGLVSASLEHRWAISGYSELTGINSGSEPVKTEASSDDLGITLRLRIDVAYSYKDYIKANVILVSEGASRYGLVLFGDHTSYYGTVEAAGGSDLLPVVDSAELMLLNASETLWCRMGLIRPHEVAKYALPGVQLGVTYGLFSMNAWYVDAGEREGWRQQAIQLKEGLDIPCHVDAAFWGAALDGSFGPVTTGIEVTLLEDKTPSQNRWNAMSSYWGAIKEDRIGTVTVSAQTCYGQWSARLAASSNFGKSYAEDDQEYEYSGKRLDVSMGYKWGSLSLQGRYLYLSGATFSHPDAVEDPGREFDGFVYYSPANGALYDSHYFRESGPPVLLGSRVTPFYGIPRPNQHYDMSAPENLIGWSLKVDYQLVSSLTVGCSAWKLNADEVYWVYRSTDDYFKPSDDLGWEIDGWFTWNPVDHLTVSGFSGVFILGDFYHEIEDYYPFGLTKPIEHFWIDSDIIHLTELGVTLWF